MGRKRPNKRQRKIRDVIHVLYEAGKPKENTEYEYFKAINQLLSSEDVSIQPVKFSQLSTKGQKSKRENLWACVMKKIDGLSLSKTDKIMICLDADIPLSEPGREDRIEKLKILLDLFHEKNIEKTPVQVIIWNSCIEVWFHMHVKIPKYLKDPKAYLYALRNLEGFENYSKTNFDFTKVIKSTSCAIENSKKKFGEQSLKGYSLFEPSFNPGSNMHSFFETTGISIVEKDKNLIGQYSRV